MMGHQLLVLAALAAPAAPLPPAPSGLVVKFEKGHTFYQTMTTHTDQSLKVLGQDVKHTQNQTFVLSWTPEKQDGDSWVVKLKVEAVKMEIDIGGQKLAYDSTKPKAAKGALGALDDFFGALVGSEFRVTLDRACRVQRVEGREEFIKRLATANLQMETLLRQVLSEDVLKQMGNPLLVSAPRREVDKGDYWVKEDRTDLGSVGSYLARWQYVHMGKENKLIKLKAEAIKFEYQAPAAGGTLPFTVKASNLKAKNATGTILFDPEKGRLHSAEMVMDMEGEMTIEVGGQESKVELWQTQKTTYKVSDTNPLTNK
jgi:Family of unknown function (DUF6263)